jgi:hypothetical protein
VSAFGDIMAGIRQVVTLEYRVTELSAEVKELKLREADTRERLIRLEGIIEMAMREGPRRIGD